MTEDKSLRETIEKTQDHCDKMADEFQRMRKYLQSMAGWFINGIRDTILGII